MLTVLWYSLCAQPPRAASSVRRVLEGCDLEHLRDALYVQLASLPVLLQALKHFHTFILS